MYHTDKEGRGGGGRGGGEGEGGCGRELNDENQSKKIRLSDTFCLQPRSYTIKQQSNQHVLRTVITSQETDKLPDTKNSKNAQTNECICLFMRITL